VALRQEGVNLKAAILPTGYGGDILQAGPGALQNAQGVYFYTSFEPVEMHTAATNQFQGYLRGLGVTTDPTYGEYVGYTSIAMIVEALHAAGKNPTSASLLTALTNLKSFDGWGLFDGRSFAPADKASQGVGAPPCVFYAKLAGSNFLLVPGADPICGTQIPGVSAPK
jgi:branched-chain amino acid transport system substrate-binding protein